MKLKDKKVFYDKYDATIISDQLATLTIDTPIERTVGYNNELAFDKSFYKTFIDEYKNLVESNQYDLLFDRWKYYVRRALEVSLGLINDQDLDNLSTALMCELTKVLVDSDVEFIPYLTIIDDCMFGKDVKMPIKYHEQLHEQRLKPNVQLSLPKSTIFKARQQQGNRSTITINASDYSDYSDVIKSIKTKTIDVSEYIDMDKRNTVDLYENRLFEGDLDGNN